MHNVLRLMLAKKRAQKTQEQREKGLARFNKKCYNKIIEKEMFIK